MVHREPGAENLNDSSESTSGGWDPPTRFPARPGQELHVWLIDVGQSNGQSGRGRGPGILSADEVQRIGRLRSKGARARFEASHLALRRILGGYLACAPSDLMFDLGAAGKPSLSSTHAANSPLWFNLSHSADLALCAVTGCAEVGVDIEELRPLRDVDRLAGRHFCPDELAAWQALGPSERLDGFYRVWKRKEALLKAAGLGLSRPLERVDTLAGILDEQSYWLRDLNLDEARRAAVACAGRPSGLKCWRWEDALDSTRGS